MLKHFMNLESIKGVTLEKAEKIIKDPLYFGTMMVQKNDVDGYGIWCNTYYRRSFKDQDFK